jgi:hypothetical protein
LGTRRWVFWTERFQVFKEKSVQEITHHGVSIPLNTFPPLVQNGGRVTFPLSTALLVFPGYALFFMMLAFPMAPSVLYVKAALFGVVVAEALVCGLFYNAFTLHFSIAALTVSFAVLGFLFALRGLFLGAPGAGNGLQIYVLWPLVYMVVLAGASQEKVLMGMRWVLLIATIFVGVQGGVYLLTFMDVLPANNYARLLSLDWQEQGIGFHEGYIGLQFPGLNSLPFLVPFAIAALATHALQDAKDQISKIWLWLALLAGLAMALVSGRRGLLVAILLAPLLTGFFLMFRPRDNRRRGLRSIIRVSIAILLLGLLILGAVNSVYEISVQGLLGRVSEGFDFTPTTPDDAAVARGEQFSALLEGWYEHPMLGAGLGAPAFGSIRSEERPWDYELYYLALLYQTGLVGILAYAAGIAWIFWKGIKVIQSDSRIGYSLLPILVGSATLLVVNGTNPYLARFDGMWVVFLPLGYVNNWLSQKGHLQVGRAPHPA